MSERWKSFLKTVIWIFIFSLFFDLLSDYFKVREDAFRDLLQPKFYTGKIFVAVFIGIFDALTNKIFFKRKTHK